MAIYKFDVGQLSDAGVVMPVNEDSCIVLRYEDELNSVILSAVADGVGGLGHGDVASSTVIEAIDKWWNKIDLSAKPNLETLFDDLTGCVKSINEDICKSNRLSGIKTGTTLTILLLTEEGYRIFHVGDSRIYRIRPGLFGDIEQLTTDHVKMMPKEINGKTVMKLYLTECIGNKPAFDYQTLSGTIQPGEVFLICTDGVYKTVPEKTILKILRKKKADVSSVCSDLVKYAKRNGEKDNITAVTIRVI